jgi:hypothetical protein
MMHPQSVCYLRNEWRQACFVDGAFQIRPRVSMARVPFIHTDLAKAETSASVKGAASYHPPKCNAPTS